MAAVYFSPNTFKEKKALISYLKNGDTWTRALVLAAFGMLISSHYLGSVPPSVQPS